MQRLKGEFACGGFGCFWSVQDTFGFCLDLQFVFTECTCGGGWRLSLPVGEDGIGSSHSQCSGDQSIGDTSKPHKSSCLQPTREDFNYQGEYPNCYISQLPGVNTWQFQSLLFRLSHLFKTSVFSESFPFISSQDQSTWRRSNFKRGVVVFASSFKIIGCS